MGTFLIDRFNMYATCGLKRYLTTYIYFNSSINYVHECIKINGKVNSYYDPSFPLWIAGMLVE